MHAFIVRPFGTKSGVDFDRVERDLIAPALDRLGVTGRTTGELARAGNIRADMFHLLLTADIVVADISIHNANVFYELGVRHALRDRRTLLLRASIDEVPFDLKTDRYLSYDPANPAGSLERLIEALEATARGTTIDSPVYGMVPGLRAPDPKDFIVVPQSFAEEAGRARMHGERGDLRFLASELSGLAWRRQGLRVVGEAQFLLGDMEYARETWESVRSELPGDLDANLRLGTIYQRSGDLVRSEQALERVIAAPGVDAEPLAEAHALAGSNAKTRWIAEWTDLDPATRQSAALRSSFLFESLDQYRQGFQTDLAHYYSGVNALAMAVAVTGLAAAQKSVWEERFESPQLAGVRLEEFQQLRSQLTGAVEFSLRAREEKLKREQGSDSWLALSFADHAFLTGKPNAPHLYRDALSRLEPFAQKVARAQYELFSELGILTKPVEAAAPLFLTMTPPKEPRQPKVLLFTGHRIDGENRPVPRFPADKEAVARDAIRQAVEAELPKDGSPVIALAGAASGGDLLFLEVCEEFGMERRVYLVIPRDDYVAASVADSGPGWVDRFNHQCASSKCRAYQQSKALPDWLAGKPDYGVWQRSNAWMLYNALALAGTNTTLIALWDGRGGDGPGGTEHMVTTANKRGARTIVLDTRKLFGLPLIRQQ